VQILPVRKARCLKNVKRPPRIAGFTGYQSVHVESDRSRAATVGLAHRSAVSEVGNCIFVYGRIAEQQKNLFHRSLRVAQPDELLEVFRREVVVLMCCSTAAGMRYRRAVRLDVEDAASGILEVPVRQNRIAVEPGS